MLRILKSVFTDATIRKRVLFVLAILTLTRFLSSVPIPGVDTTKFASYLADNQALGLLNVFSGGGLSSLSIMMLGVGPYITASIIMQLLTVLIPRLKALYQEEGENGRRKFIQYGRMLTPVFAVLQGVALISLLAKQQVIELTSYAHMAENVIIVTAGTMLMMWLGEIINERGIGNGVSLIIFSGIVAQLPTKLSQLALTFSAEQIPFMIVMAIVSILVVVGVIYITEAERPIQITYAKQSRDGRTSTVNSYLPIRLNQTGVMPIIFAVSILLFPQVASQLLAGSNTAGLVSLANYINNALTNQWVYGIVYFALIVIFTYFYTAVTFDPDKTAENLQKNGAFMSGHRPGESTANYITAVLSRVTFVGAVFLGVIAVLPIIVQAVSGVTAVAIGGTSLLIAVSVVIDMVKKIDAQISMREY